MDYICVLRNSKTFVNNWDCCFFRSGVCKIIPLTKSFCALLFTSKILVVSKKKKNHKPNLFVFPVLIKVQRSALMRLQDKTTSELITLQRLAEVFVRFKTHKMFRLNIRERTACSGERVYAAWFKWQKQSANTWQWKQALLAGAQRGGRVNLRVTCSYYTVELSLSEKTDR